ncbi:MAG: porphobilinogen synthase [Myxococcota bacterium]
MDLLRRPRRNRKSAVVRAWARETDLRADHLIYPVFIREEEGTAPIPSMPGQSRLGPEALLRMADHTLEAGVRSMVLFPAVEERLKTSDARECTNPDGLVPKSLRALKARFPELSLVTDVALDPYSSDGHDGLVREGQILNDETVEILVQQALSQAEAGADVIAPSDMMDGRVGAIRQGLDEAGHSHVSIMAYSAKYASAFYGPFRDALESAPKSGDKKTYQMDPANVREGVMEAMLDEDEGADVLMVKPAGAYLDVIRAVREATPLPVAAYQVSGEYAQIVATAERGWLDRDRIIEETLLSIRRAGASVILSYFSVEVAPRLGV